MPWSCPGAPHYLDAAGRRLKIAPTLLNRARGNPEIVRAAGLCGQLSGRLGRRAAADVPAAELAQVRGTLAEAEAEAVRLHALAAAVEAMLAEAYAAFGLEPPERPARVHCDFDDPPGRGPADLRPIRLMPGSRREKAHRDADHERAEQRDAGQPGQ